MDKYTEIKNDIKVIAKLIKKYKAQGNNEYVKYLQKIGLDLACEDFVKRDINKDTFFSFTKGEFVSYNRKS